MSRWESIEAFVAVVEMKSFSKAAEKLGVSKSHISRQINQLENRLDTQLLNRTTRAVSLTELGQTFYPTCKDMLNSLDEAERAIIEQQHSPKGLLRVSVAGLFAEEHITPAAIKFMQLNPSIEIDMDFTNRVVDVISEGFDLAIRSGTLQDSSYIARRIAPRKLVVCASPDYLSQRGRPSDIHALINHNCLMGTLQTWRFKEKGRHIDLRLNGNWRSNNGRALVKAAEAGMGVVQLPSFYVDQSIEAGLLQTILEENNPTDTGTWAVYPSNRHLSQKVRLFINFLADEFKSM
ncbi:LysR family transcriptional regulator [Sessilibacter sp. MAH4]